MKKLTIYCAWLFISITAMTMSSCIDDDDNDQKIITPEQQMAYMRQTDGNYTGNIRFYNDTLKTTNNVDSVDCKVSMTASDSTIILSDVSPRILSKVLKGDENKELREAIDQLPLQTLRMRHLFYSATDNGLIVFGVYPQKTTLTVNMNGQDMKMEYTFYTVWNANGEYYNREVVLNFFIQEVKVNGTTRALYDISTTYFDKNCMFNVYAKNK